MAFSPTILKQFIDQSILKIIVVKRCTSQDTHIWVKSAPVSFLNVFPIAVSMGAVVALQAVAASWKSLTIISADKIPKVSFLIMLLFLACLIYLYLPLPADIITKTQWNSASCVPLGIQTFKHSCPSVSIAHPHTAHLQTAKWENQVKVRTGWKINSQWRNIGVRRKRRERRTVEKKNR